jgi:hypothetical protein
MVDKDKPGEESKPKDLKEDKWVKHAKSQILDPQLNYQALAYSVLPQGDGTRKHSFVFTSDAGAPQFTRVSIFVASEPLSFTGPAGWEAIFTPTQPADDFFIDGVATGPPVGTGWLNFDTHDPALYLDPGEGAPFEYVMAAGAPSDFPTIVGSTAEGFAQSLMIPEGQSLFLFATGAAGVCLATTAQRRFARRRTRAGKRTGGSADFAASWAARRIDCNGSPLTSRDFDGLEGQDFSGEFRRAAGDRRADHPRTAWALNSRQT